MSYTFENLSPLDFEKIGVDLLQKHLDLPLMETFKPGKDWGIDARCVLNSKKTIIIQCKHYSNFQNLQSDLKIELSKIEKLASRYMPMGYILVTSLGLSPQDKEKIMQILLPYIKRTKDIYGRDELNNLLRKYPEVEKNHFKLWFHSTEVLEKILSKDIYNQTDFEIDNIKKKVQLYVENGNIGRVEAKLKESNFCIISGPPGVGKTTLAGMLAIAYILRKYELIVLSEDITEAYKTYVPNKKVLYYYDDFLGPTFLKDSLPKNEDSRLVKFIDKIKRDKNKKFILTTREYILQQASEKYEKINNSDILSSKFVIELKQYSDRNKAEILFNHLYFSNIDKNCIFDLKKNKKYIDIVRHENFNPRLIEFITKKEHFKNIGYSYGEWCIKSLNNPERIWSYAFENISYGAKALCYLVTVSQFTLYGRSCQKYEAEFLIFYNKFCSKYNLEVDSNSFKKAFHEIEGSFISLKKKKQRNGISKLEIEFINPSVNDFMESLIRKDDDLTKKLILLFSKSFQITKILNILSNADKNKVLKILSYPEIQEHILNVSSQTVNQMEGENNDLFSSVFSVISDRFFKKIRSF